MYKISRFHDAYTNDILGANHEIELWFNSGKQKLRVMMMCI